MTRPDPFEIDDEDPFADSFASFDEPQPAPGDSLAPDAEAAEGPAPVPPAAAEAPLDLPAEAAEPHAASADDAAPAAAAREDAPFDWFANFPKTADTTSAGTSADPAAEPAAKRRGLGWLSAGSRRAAAPAQDSRAATDAAAKPEPTAPAVASGFAEAVEPEPESVAEAPPAPAAFDDAFTEPDPFGLTSVPEPEVVAEAPSVPAAFDDALTEPEPFGLISAPEPVGEAAPIFAEREPEPQPASAGMAEVIASAEAAAGEAVVPRIAIHVFAQRAETAAVAQTAAADRRLQRASTAVRPGGLPEALALYASSPTPALVIVENTAPAAQLLADLDRLAEVCDPGTKVVVIGEANDIGLYRELIRRGVSEYLVPPLSPLQLIRTIGGLYSDPTTPFVGRTIAFVGAKGGVGASTMAHNFAWCLSERIEAQACVVDYDLAFGTAGLDFNQDPVQGLHDALTKPDRLDPTLIDRMLARCSERLSLFAAPATLDDDYDISDDAYEEVAAKIRSTAPFMVLDLPHVWSGWMRKTLLSADEVVLVAQPDLASLRNAKNLVELITKARPNDAPPRLVLNQMGLPGRPEIPLKEFSKALGLEPAMIVPFDAKLFGQASNNGQMIGEVNPRAKASEAMMEFAQAVTRREAIAAKPKSLVERLLKGG